MNLTAIRPVYVGGRLVAPGETFSTTEEHGESLAKTGEARSRKEPAAKPKPKADDK